jgi:threonine dehydratase
LSFAAGEVKEQEARTVIADGMACRKPDPWALAVLRAGLDRIVMVDDEEVKAAMRAYFADTHNVAEGSGAAGLAALLKDREAGGKRVGTVLTGGNVNSELFGEVLSSEPAHF